MLPVVKSSQLFHYQNEQEILTLLVRFREATMKLAFERWDDIAQDDIDDLLKDYLEAK